MRAATLPFRFASWLAIAAMAFNALWPLLAQARPAAPPALLEICTAAGVRLAEGAVGHEPVDGAERHLKPHCALCSVGADKAPAVAPVVHAVWQSIFAYTQTFPSPAEPLWLDRFFTAAQPRAPPFLLI